MILSDVKAETSYKIVGIKDGELKRRLLDMGFTPGHTISIRALAPLRDTILVGLRGFNVALRKNATEYIYVEEINDISRTSRQSERRQDEPV